MTLRRFFAAGSCFSEGDGRHLTGRNAFAPRTTADVKTHLMLAKYRAKKKELFLSVVSVRGSPVMRRVACNPPYNGILS